jgi:transposase
MKTERKVRRTFSTTFKKEKVKLIETGKISVKELSVIYEVTPAAIYKWLKKFSNLPKTERVVIENVSE